jgi:allophanate hydrolase subunit 1
MMIDQISDPVCSRTDSSICVTHAPDANAWQVIGATSTGSFDTFLSDVLTIGNSIRFRFDNRIESYSKSIF